MKKFVVAVLIMVMVMAQVAAFAVGMPGYRENKKYYIMPNDIGSLFESEAVKLVQFADVFPKPDGSIKESWVFMGAPTRAHLIATYENEDVYNGVEDGMCNMKLVDEEGTIISEFTVMSDEYESMFATTCYMYMYIVCIVNGWV